MADPVRIGGDSRHNITLTSRDSRVDLFSDADVPTRDLQRRLETSRLHPGDVAGAVLAPILTLHLASDEATSTDWVVTSIDTDQMRVTRRIVSPWRAQPPFGSLLDGFWAASLRGGGDVSEVERLHNQAHDIGETLGAVLTPQEQAGLSTPTSGGAPPLLVIESNAPDILALPWELLRLGGQYSVREGLLDIARCWPVRDAPELGPPSHPFTLLANVSTLNAGSGEDAPESHALIRLMHDQIPIWVNESGDLDDLIMALCQERPTTGFHFSGYGAQGELEFEDAYGDAQLIRADALLDTMRQAAGTDSAPRFFYLDLTSDETTEPRRNATEPPSIVDRIATASALHRAGAAQVVVYHGPRQETTVLSEGFETQLYAALAQGLSTREGVRTARLSMVRTLDEPPTADANGPHGMSQHAARQSPFAWAHLMLYQRSPDFPLGLPALLDDAPPEAPSGLIGRRRALQAFWRAHRQGSPLHIVHGRAGYGKTAFCQEILAIYKRLGYATLTLRCAELEDDPEPVNVLLHQFTEQASKRVGEHWRVIAAMVNELAEDQSRLFDDADRLCLLLSAFLQQSDRPLALYLDHCDALMAPCVKDGEGQWRDATAAKLWLTLAHYADREEWPLVLLASSRYCRRDFEVGLLPLNRLPDGAIWCLMRQRPALARLSRRSRGRLLVRFVGNLQAIAWLDALIRDSFERWERTHGPFPAPAETSDRNEWRQIIAPVLPSVNQPLSETILFKALWERVLTQPAQSLLVRASVLRHPADTDLLCALAVDAKSDAEAHETWRQLLACALLDEHPGNGDAGLRFSVKSGIGCLARQAASTPESLLQQGHFLAGEALEERVLHAGNPHVSYEAAYHLAESGEVDRAFDLLLGLTQWLNSQDRFLESRAALNSLRRPEALETLNQIRYLTAQGQLSASMGDLDQALADLHHAVGLCEQLTHQDTANIRSIRTFVPKPSQDFCQPID